MVLQAVLKEVLPVVFDRHGAVRGRGSWVEKALSFIVEVPDLIKPVDWNDCVLTEKRA